MWFPENRYFIWGDELPNDWWQYMDFLSEIQVLARKLEHSI